MSTPWPFAPHSTFLVLSILVALLSFAFFVSGLVAMRRKKILGMVTTGTLALLLFVTALLFGSISVGLRGYETLTKETIVVRVSTQPTGEQRFEARFEFPDGSVETFDLAGDQLYVDAHILKWKSLANLFGLHTQYALSRVGGRYASLEDERERERTVHALGPESAVDLFALRRRFERLSPFFDAEYGSATWVDVQAPGEFEVRLSTTGLLLRSLTPPEPQG